MGAEWIREGLFDDFGNDEEIVSGARRVGGGLLLGEPVTWFVGSEDVHDRGSVSGDFDV